MSLADYEDPWVAAPRPAVQGPSTPPTWAFVPVKALPLDSEPGCWTAPDLFFGETTEQIQGAKAMCRRCPVREECLALGKDEREGIWGGLTAHERRHPGRRRQPAPVVPVVPPVRVPPVPEVKVPPVPKLLPPPAPESKLAQVIRFPVERVRPHPLCPPNVNDCAICYPDG